MVDVDDSDLIRVHKKIQDSADNINEIKKNMDPLGEQNKQSYEKLCLLLNTLVQNIQSTVDVRREQIEQSKSPSSAQAHDTMYNLDKSNYLLPTKNLQPIMSNAFQSMPYAAQSLDAANSTTKVLQMLDAALSNANNILQNFATEANKNQQSLFQIYKSFNQNYATKVMNADYALKSTMDIIPFAVPGYGRAGIKLVLELAKINTPIKFETKRKEYIEELERSNTANTIDPDWLSFMKDTNPTKARAQTTRYLNVISKTCSETIFQHYANVYKTVGEISAFFSGAHLFDELAPAASFLSRQNALETKLDELFPGQDMGVLVSSAIASSPSTFMTSPQIRCVEPKLNDTLSLKEYLERDEPDFCDDDVEPSRKRQRIARGADNNSFICRGVNLLTEDTDSMRNTIEFMAAQGFAHDTIVDHVTADWHSPFESVRTADGDVGVGGARKSVKNINMENIKSAFSQHELNKLISPIGYTLINSHKIFQFQNFNFHNMFVDLSEYFGKEHVSINDFYNNITRFYTGETSMGEVSLWQLLHNCLDPSMAEKLRIHVAASEFSGWTKALFISKVCLDETMTDVTLENVINENKNLLFPLKLSFREATIISQYYARTKNLNHLAKSDISLYCPLDNIVLQPHIFITILYIVGLYRAWLDNNISKTSVQINRTSTAKNNILTQVHSFLTPGSTTAFPLLTTLLIAKVADFVLRTMTIATSQIKENNTEVSNAAYMESLKSFGHATIENHAAMKEALPNLIRAADAFSSKIAVAPCLDAFRSNLYISNYQINQWAMICLDQQSFGAYLKRQPDGDSIIALNRNIAITLYVQNKNLYESMQRVPELNESSSFDHETNENSMLAELESVLDLDELSAAKGDDECTFDSVYLRTGATHTYLTKFLHDCLTKKFIKNMQPIVKWYYYYIATNVDDLDAIILPNGDTMQLISYANIFSQPHFESFFEHTATSDDNTLVGEERYVAKKRNDTGRPQRVFISPYPIPDTPESKKIFTHADSFKEIESRRGDLSLDTSLEIFVPIRTTNFANFKAIRHGDNLVVMNANTPYSIVQQLVKTFNIFCDEDGWTITINSALKPNYTRIALLPSNMTTPKTTAGLFYHVSKRESGDGDTHAQMLKLLEFCAPIDEIVIDCTIIAKRIQDMGATGSDTIPLFENIDYEVSGGMLFDAAGSASTPKRKLRAAKTRKNNASLSKSDLVFSRDFEQQYQKSRALQADKLLKKLNKWDKTYHKYMDRMSNTCDLLQNDPNIPDMKGFFVEFQPNGIREIFTKFDAKAASKASRYFDMVPMNNTFSSLALDLAKLDKLRPDGEKKSGLNISSLHKNLAQFNLLFNMSANAHRAFIRTAFETVDQIEKFVLFALIAPLAQLHFYRNMNMYLFNDIPSKFSYLERFLTRDSAYLQLNVQSFATYLSENVDFFERNSALFNYYTFYQNMANDQRSFLFILTPTHILRSSSSMFYLGLIAIFFAHNIEQWRVLQNTTASAPVPASPLSVSLPVATVLNTPTTPSVIPATVPRVATVLNTPTTPSVIPRVVANRTSNPTSAATIRTSAATIPTTVPIIPTTVPTARTTAQTNTENWANYSDQGYIWIPVTSVDWATMLPQARVSYILDNYANYSAKNATTQPAFDVNKNYIMASRPAAELIYNMISAKDQNPNNTTINDMEIILQTYFNNISPNQAPTGDVERKLEQDITQMEANIRNLNTSTPMIVDDSSSQNQSVPF